MFTPARPNVAKKGSVARREIEHAIKQGKTVIAIDTGSTTRHAAFFSDNDIPIVPARKDSIAKAVNMANEQYD